MLNRANAHGWGLAISQMRQHEAVKLDEERLVRVLHDVRISLNLFNNIGGAPEARDARIRFYSELVQEVRGFNDAWRRHVSHADASAFYNRDSAHGVFVHVKSFFRGQLQRLSDQAVIPKYWLAR